MPYANEDPSIATLFKYLPPPGSTNYALENIERILRDGLIRLSSRNELNDPFETWPTIVGKPSPDTVYKVLARAMDPARAIDAEDLAKRQRLAAQYGGRAGLLKNKAINFRKYRELVEQTALRPIDICGFASLSEVSDSIAMWSHYASSHRGICVEWSKEFHQFPGLSLKVKYRSSRPAFHIDQILLIDGELDFDTLFGALGTKAPAWSYEREWRFFGLNVREPASSPSPGGSLVDFDRAAIKSVTFGANADNSTVETVRRLISDLDPKPLLRRATLSKTKYEIEFERV